MQVCLSKTVQLCIRNIAVIIYKYLSCLNNFTFYFCAITCFKNVVKKYKVINGVQL